MPGLAQRLFFEREGRNLSSETETWPFLKKLVSDKRLASIDLALAEMLLKPYPNAKEEVASFLCYLSLATRQGHLCIRVAEKITPESAALFQSCDDDFASLVRKGAELIPAPLLEGPLRRNGESFYFERYWSAEQKCLQLFNNCLQTKPVLEAALVADRVKQLLELGELLPEQAEAIVKAMQNSVTLLSGGPGTGKTYTIGHLVRLFLACLPAASVALAAPTGKAAMHLGKSLNLSNLKADTLHALLGVGSRKTPDLSADLIIVDESSMIDITLMNALLSAIKPGARLVLSGDRHQLAPVGSGSLFADLAQYATHHTVELKKCLRTDRTSIVQFASLVQTGDTQAALRELSQSQDGLFYHPQIDTNLEEVVARFDPKNHAPEQLLARFGSFRLLSPLRKGPYGVDEINSKCRLLASKRHHTLSPIIITKTDRRLGLFNGETGCVDEEQAYFPGDEGMRRFPKFLLPPFEYAYCLSVYKSQGSEFDEVWIVLPEGSQYFGREVLYTAVTRARFKVQIWSTPEVLQSTIERQAVRLSGLS